MGEQSCIRMKALLQLLVTTVIIQHTLSCHGSLWDRFCWPLHLPRWCPLSSTLQSNGKPCQISFVCLITLLLFLTPMMFHRFRLDRKEDDLALIETSSSVEDLLRGEDVAFWELEKIVGHRTCDVLCTLLLHFFVDGHLELVACLVDCSCDVLNFLLLAVCLDPIDIIRVKQGHEPTRDLDQERVWRTGDDVALNPRPSEIKRPAGVEL